MKICPSCQESYGAHVKFCPRDGTPLEVKDRPEDPLVGRIMGGRYEILERLGAGGFGTVYRARDTRLDDVEALKVFDRRRLPPREAQEAAERFTREAKLLRKLGKRSEHIVGVTNFEKDDAEDLFYFAMDYVQGDNLAQVLIREGPLPLGRGLDIARQICDALIVAHREGVVHRDMKLENVMLSRDGGREVAKVLDFGIAKIMGHGSLTDLSLGGPGTPGYAAPEQIDDPSQIDVRTDLFALGVVIYAMLTGHEPWTGKLATEPTSQGWMALVHKTLHEEPIAPRSLRPEMPVELESLILKLLQKKKEDRLPSAEALDALLKDIQTSRLPGEFRAEPPAGAATRLRPEPALDTASAASPRRPPLVAYAKAGAVAISLLLLAGLGVVLWPRSVPELAYSAFLERLERGDVAGVRVTKGWLLAQVESAGNEDSEVQIPLAGVPLQRIMQRIDSLAVPVHATGEGVVEIRPVTGETRRPATGAEVSLESPGFACAPCDLASEHEMRAGWYDVRTLGPQWTLESLTIRYADRAFGDETIAAEEVSRIFVPEDGDLELNLLVAPTRLGRLLQSAGAALEAGRFGAPAGDNALDYVREALALDPANSAALELAARLADRLRMLAQAAVAAGDLAGAGAHVERCLDLLAGNPGCVEAGEQIRLARAEQAGERRAAASRPVRTPSGGGAAVAAATGPSAVPGSAIKPPVAVSATSGAGRTLEDSAAPSIGANPPGDSAAPAVVTRPPLEDPGVPAVAANPPREDSAAPGSAMARRLADSIARDRPGALDAPIAAPVEPAAAVSGFSVVRNEVVDRDGMGIDITVRFATRGPGDAPWCAAAYFSDAGGMRLSDDDGEYALGGQVAAVREFTPRGIPQDVTLFLPADALHLEQMGEHRLTAEVRVWNRRCAGSAPTEPPLARSRPIPICLVRFLFGWDRCG